MPVNIEIKGNADSDVASFQRTAELLAAFLNARPQRADEVIVVSFNDAAVATSTSWRRASGPRRG